MPSARNWLPAYLAEDWPPRLLAATWPGERYRERNTVLIAVLYYCGLRVSEALALTVDCVSLDRRTIHVRLGKGRKQRYVGIGRRLYELLAPYLIGLPAGGCLFPSRAGGRLGRRQALNVIKARARTAGLPAEQVFNHLMRHGFAEHTLRALKALDPGDALARVRDAMGHSSIAVTSIYLSVSPDRLLETFDAIP